MKLRDAFAAQQLNRDEPQPINAGRCEHMLGSLSKYGGGPAYCGKNGRWLVRGQIRCGQHRDET